MKCSDCGAENLDGKRFCGQCGATLEALPVQPETPPMQQASLAATAPASFHLSERTKKRLAVGAIAVVIIVIIASALGYLYYYQPVRGSGSVSTTTIDEGQEVQFDFTPTKGVSPYRYSWSFGDGGYSAEAAPHHSYSTPGTYLVMVTVKDTAGKTTTWTTTITVNPLPSVVATVSPSVGVLSLNATFTAQGVHGTPDYSYSWQFGDGASSNSQNPTHDYSLGTYTATVVVRDGAGMTASWSVNISVNLNLTVGVIVDWVGPGDTISFTCTPSQGVPPYSFYWQFGDGSSTLQNFEFNYGRQGTTTVFLNVTDSVGEIVHYQKVIDY